MSSQEVSSQPFRWHYADFDDGNFQIRGRTLFFVVVLFSIIIVFTLLFIYARWICRFSHPPPPAATSAPHVGRDPASVAAPQGLDLATINNMPIVLYKNSSAAAGKFTEAECCICLGIFGEKEKVKLLPQCSHCFHSECVDKWLTAQSSCPLCRAPLQVDSPV
ncbi:hypothetical protein CDL12_04826 [Handroanthus impetiginosus]|uniref:RING-type E3 ubiquitin transferase n=1 Tax=Handroanthus impetiginosus TaxID=429701 RepID=A0A2G9HYP1_9LAMI|nr:hypothetical protein CDL12_04826 [Handroanthus impetiginosus]